jgi:hypothetical protein
VTSRAISPITSQVFYHFHKMFIRSDWRIEMCANKLASLSGNAILGNNDIGEFLFLLYFI